MSATTTKKQPETLDLLIVGGGLSGVFLAHELHKNNPAVKWALVEARSTLGGRLANDSQGRRIDLGGAWVWPEHQPHMKSLLLQNLSLITFRQPDDPSSTRIEGGAVEIVNQLAKDLPKDQVYLDSPVTSCTLLNESETQQQQCSANDNSKQLIQVDMAGGRIFLATTVVMAAPPKLVSKHIQFTPALSTEKQSAMDNSHTWMAGVTKISLVYPTSFWEKDMSNMGLPGNSGPAFQMYDASTNDGSVHALTFFALVPPHSPAIHDDTKLADQIVGQVGMVWNYYGRKEMAQQLQSYSEVHVHRWSQENYISEDDKPTTIHPHPHPAPMLSKPAWDGQLLFAGSETDLRSPGVMEGAVGAAHRVYSQLQAQLLQATDK